MNEKLKPTKLAGVCLWLLLLLCGTPIAAFASQSTSSYTLKMKKRSKTDNHTTERHRSSQIDIICNISEEGGIQIGTETASIYSYELWDEAGETCVAAFSEESDFISFLFANPGNYQLRFLTDEYTLVGYI